MPAMHRRLCSLAATTAKTNSIDVLKDFVYSAEHLVVITGAGISTDSGIPDYRGINGSYKKGHQPMKHQDFMSSEYQRQRYWARSVPGFRTFSSAQPNAGHFALSNLELNGVVRSIITQNVDRLHQKAGSRHVIDLHGRGDMCRCMQCSFVFPRAEMQERVAVVNHEWLQRVKVTSAEDIRPDGDSDIGINDFSGFIVPDCLKCGGIIKPDVVFFGDSVPKERTEEASQVVTQADKLLVVGSTLMVFSAFKHVSALVKRGGQVAIVNMGETRAQKNGLPVAVHIDDNISTVLQALAR